MPVTDWQYTSYQSAAEQMCYRLCESPYDNDYRADGTVRPKWVAYAERMVEQRVMVECMQQFGPTL